MVQGGLDRVWGVGEGEASVFVLGVECGRQDSYGFWDMMVSELNLGGKEGLVICREIPTRKRAQGWVCEKRWCEVHWASFCRLLRALEQGAT